MHILNATQTAQALPYSALVPAIGQAAREKAEHRIHAPDRQVVPIDEASVLLGMPAIGADIGVTKLITVHTGNAKHKLPAIQGEVIVFDTATGRRLALLDAPTVTARRTAAVTLLGIERLALKRPSSVLLIGTGTQASAHADALIEYLGIRQFRVAGLDMQSAEAFCKDLRARHGDVAALPADISKADRDCVEVDVIIALTTSKTPVIPVNIPPSTLSIGVGAFKPDMAEFPPELLHRRAIVVDDLAGARHEAGDLIQAQIDWSRVRELSEAPFGDGKPDGEAPVFKTVGQAAWDLAAARVVLASLRKE